LINSTVMLFRFSSSLFHSDAGGIS